MIFKLPYQKGKAISYIERNDKDMLCEVRKDKRNRSIVQNAYYWFLLNMLEQEIGEDKDNWHLYFKNKFLITTQSINNEWIDYAQSTTKLHTIEFEDYLEKIRIFASRELGCFLPKPNETEFDYLDLK